MSISTITCPVMGLLHGADTFDHFEYLMLSSLWIKAKCCSITKDQCHSMCAGAGAGRKSLMHTFRFHSSI